jgi:hypothetical protein
MVWNLHENSNGFFDITSFQDDYMDSICDIR